MMMRYRFINLVQRVPYGCFFLQHNVQYTSVNKIPIRKPNVVFFDLTLNVFYVASHETSLYQLLKIESRI